MASGTGWGDMGDKGDKPGYNTWNVDVFVTVIQDLVNILNWFEQLWLQWPSLISDFVISAKGLRVSTANNWLIFPGSSFKLARGSGRAWPPKFPCVEQEGAAHSPAGP